MNSDNADEDRKSLRRNSFKNKHQEKKIKDIEKRDFTKIKQQRKHKIEEMKQEEIWQEWSDEVY